MGWMILRVLAGQASVGDVVLFFQAFGQGQRLLATLLRNTEIYKECSISGESRTPQY